MVIGSWLNVEAVITSVRAPKRLTQTVSATHLHAPLSLGFLSFSPCFNRGDTLSQFGLSARAVLVCDFAEASASLTTSSQNQLMYKRKI